MSVYLLLGEDNERKARSLMKLGKGLQRVTLDAAQTSPEEVVSACNSYSLFGDGQLVVLRDLDAWNADQKARLLGYLQNPASQTTLVLIARKLGARERLMTAVKNAGEVHTLDPPKGRDLARWLTEYAKEQGTLLSEDVAVELISRCGEEKTRLMREVEKLALYAGEDGVSASDVEALCPPAVESNIFAFVDALAAGDRGKSLRLLEELIVSGEPPLRLLYMIRRQYQLLLKARSLFARGAASSEAAAALKVPPFVVRKLQDQGRRLEDEDIENALSAVLELERGLKGESALTDALQLERAVLDLAG